MFLQISSMLVLVGSTIIPIRFSEYNQPFIPSATIPGVYSRDSSGLRHSFFDVVVSFERNSGIRCGTHDEYDYAVMDGIRLDGDFPLVPRAQTDFSDYTDRWSAVSGRSRSTGISVGVAPTSHLMTEYNTISILRNISSNTGVLILSDLDAIQFNRSCVPGSIAPISYPLNVEYRAAYPNNADGPGREILLTPQRAPSFHIGNILTLPNTMALAIYDTIRESRAVRARGSNLVTNCNLGSLRDRLPTITLNFTTTNAAVVLYPEDYMSFNATSNECILRFDRQEGDDQHLSINPLRFPDVNLHLTRDGILICDSQ